MEVFIYNYLSSHSGFCDRISNRKFKNMLTYLKKNFNDKRCIEKDEIKKKIQKPILTSTEFQKPNLKRKYSIFNI